MVESFLKKLKAKGWKQKDIAEKCGFVPNYISGLINGSNCSIETVIKIADAFGVSTDEVLGRSNKHRTVTPEEDMLLQITQGNQDITRAALRSAMGEKHFKEEEGEGRRVKGKAA